MACHDRRHRQMQLGVLLTLITVSSALYAPSSGAASVNAGLLASSTGPSFEERVEKLLSQLTLPEKISQLNTDSPAIPALNISAFSWWQGAAELAFLGLQHPAWLALGAPSNSTLQQPG